MVTLPYAVRLKKLVPELKILSHIHELNTIILTMAPDFPNYIKHTDLFIAASEIVKTNLTDNWGIEPANIEVIYEFTDRKFTALKKSTAVFTVGASGLSHWRKGNDVFLLVARHINTRYPEARIKFVWVGHEGRDKAMIDADIKKMELENMVEFVGEKIEPEQEYKNFDIFLLPSREDPFPLVCIEAAMLNKPIICFEGASGTAEIVKKGGGFVTPYLDHQSMAEKIMYYYNNPDNAIKDGEIAGKLFAKYNPEIICPLIYERINALL